MNKDTKLPEYERKELDTIVDACNTVFGEGFTDWEYKSDSKDVVIVKNNDGNDMMFRLI